jgi:DNA-binding NtrC family response regulator
MDPINKNAKGWILVVDDEPLKRITLQIELTEAGYQVYEAAEAKTALRILDSRPIDVVVTDLKMPGMDGLTFLEHIKQRRADVHVILMTAFGTVDTAVAAMKRGAYDYLTKPFTTDILLSKIDQLLAYRSTSVTAKTQGAVCESLGRLIGHSLAMRNLFQQIRTVADSERTILIDGESGTGKELVAEAIHELSRRRDKPLIKFSGAALQPTLIESELFGHEKGAFTHAISRKLGRFELADGGTLFLDEVDDLPLEVQVKLLRGLEQQTFERVGGEEVIQVDVRLVCATKKNLRQLVEVRRFREDLYYRLNVINLTIPPLRDRREDVPVLVAHFIEKHATSGPDGTRPTILPHALDLLMKHDWPGNVRELEHVMERALAFCGIGQIGPEHIPPLTGQKGGGDHVIPFAEVGAGLTETVASIEKRMIESALVQADYNQAKAAQILGIPRTTLRDKIAKYGLGAGPPIPGGNPSSVTQ